MRKGKNVTGIFDENLLVSIEDTESGIAGWYLIAQFGQTNVMIFSVRGLLHKSS